MPDETQDLSKTLHQFLRIAVRRRWWLLLPACGVALATITASLLLPNRYTSEATILVVQQQVPQRYVTPNSTYSVKQALESLTEAVLSRSRLLLMVDEFGLYPKERHLVGPEGLVQLMRKNIQIDPIQKESTQQDINAFKISFTANQPQLAQDVASRLTSLFIAENLKLKEEQDTGTTSFLKDQLASAQTDLARQEQTLRNFRTHYLGELPEQQQGNLAILSGLHMQLQNTMGELSRAQEQRVYLTSLIDQYRGLSAKGLAVADSTGVSPLAKAEADLDALKSRRRALLAQYTLAYPGVREIDQDIAQQENLIATLRAAKKSVTRSGQRSVVTSEGAESSSVAQLNSQLEANRLEIENLTRGEKNLQNQVAQYEQRLNLTPVREQELADIMRRYDLSKQNYADLLSKVTQSELATSLEQRQQGQQFRVIDPASLPEKPSGPKRIQIALGGVMAGLLVGAALAFLIDSMDHAFYAEKDLTAQFNFPLILALPAVFVPSEQRWQAWRKVFEWCAGTVLVFGVVIAEYFICRGA